MVWFQCEDCGENLKKPKLRSHFNMCTATKLSCIDCGNMFGQDSVQWHTQCMTETEKYGPKRQSKAYNDSVSPANPNSIQELDFDLNVGLSNQYPWYCSLCNVKATSEQSLLSHAVGNKHRVNVERFDDKQEQRQPEHVTVVKEKDSSWEQIKFDVNIGLSNHYPWFCSLCNTKATSQQTLLSHANGKKHRQNVEWFNANQLQQSEQSTLDKKDQFEKDTGYSEQKKVDLHVSSGVANGYSQADKKRKLETFDETWKREVVQAEEAEVGKSKKAKKQDHEKKGKKKQTESDSDFEYDKEDMKLLLVSYSKEELVNLVYKTAEKGSRLMSAIIESADRDISQRNIFVRGFGWDTTHEHLKAAFESYGEIEECSVVMDKDTGRSKGYGFVLFKTRKGAVKALKNPEKRMYNRTVVCNLASAKPYGAGKAHDTVEPSKIDLTQMANQSDVALPGIELAHRHVHEQRHQQPTMEMYGQNMPFYGHSQLPGFEPMYGVLTGNQMVGSLPNYYIHGSGLMNQGSVVPSNYMGMAGQYLGDVEHSWYPR